MDSRVNYFVIDGNDLFVGGDDNTIRRYDFDKLILDRKASESCLKWKSQPFKYLWGFSLWREWIYVCDYYGGVFTLDRNCGVDRHSPKIDWGPTTPTLGKPAHITFIPQCNEMVICGVGFVEIFTLSNDGAGDENDIPGWKSKVKSPSPNGASNLYSIFYEQTSDRIFVTDSESSVLTFDRNLNVVNSFEIIDYAPGIYGVNIDEVTGYCYVCKKDSYMVTIYE